MGETPTVGPEQREGHEMRRTNTHLYGTFWHVKPGKFVPVSLEIIDEKPKTSFF